MHLANPIGWKQSTKLHGFINSKTTTHKVTPLTLWTSSADERRPGVRKTVRGPIMLRMFLSFSLVSLCVDCAN